MFSKLFKRNASADAARKAYETIVTQARQPAYYTRYGAADTLDGRFDLLVLNTALVLIRLKGGKGESDQFTQALFDTLFADMDQSLREIGVSDISVGKKVKEMGRAFYGRLDAYAEALEAPEAGRQAALAEALRRNLYRGVDGVVSESEALAAHVIDQAAHLGAQEDGKIIAGDLDFLAP